ncbi:MAG: lipase family protein [Bacteroidota bacterium]
MNIHFLQFAKKVFPLYIILVSVSLSCSINDPQVFTTAPSSERGHLISYSKTGTMTAEEVVSANRRDLDLSEYADYDFDIYSIVYNSLDGGDPLEVSGLVFIPKGVVKEFDLLQNHHGTIIPGDNNEVPSTYEGGRRGSSEMYLISAAMASNGYVVSMPDYVGYGVTSDREHPYTIHHELAEVSVDMLRATKQLLATLSVASTNEVFLMGWSEGGGAGLATHKYLQEKYAAEFIVKGSSLFAGPYDYFSFIKDIMSNREVENENLSIYSWSAYAMNNYQQTLNNNPNSIWNYSVTNQIDALYVPSYKPAGIFQESFMDGISQEFNAEWVAAAKANTLLEGWTPQGQLFFHSGTDDFIVPHYNSVNAHEHFKSLDVNSTIYEYPGGDHYTPVYDYVINSLKDFEKMKN